MSATLPWLSSPITSFTAACHETGCHLWARACLCRHRQERRHPTASSSVCGRQEQHGGGWSYRARLWSHCRWLLQWRGHLHDTADLDGEMRDRCCRDEGELCQVPSLGHWSLLPWKARCRRGNHGCSRGDPRAIQTDCSYPG